VATVSTPLVYRSFWTPALLQLAALAVVLPLLPSRPSFRTRRGPSPGLLPPR